MQTREHIKAAIREAESLGFTVKLIDLGKLRCRLILTRKTDGKVASVFCTTGRVNGNARKETICNVRRAARALDEGNRP